MTYQTGPFGWTFVDDLEEDEREKWTIREMAFFIICLDKNNSSRRKAIAKARREFIDIAEIEPRIIRKVSVLGEQEVTLFTSIQIEYEIQIIANSKAVDKFYQRKKEKEDDRYEERRRF